MSENNPRSYGTQENERMAKECGGLLTPSELSPASGSPSGVELEVCADIAARQAKGVSKYGVTVANNPLELKAWLQHAYEECLDQAVYLKRAMREMENDQAHPTAAEKGH